MGLRESWGWDVIPSCQSRDDISLKSAAEASGKMWIIHSQSLKYRCNGCTDVSLFLTKASDKLKSSINRFLACLHLGWAGGFLFQKLPRFFKCIHVILHIYRKWSRLGSLYELCAHRCCSHVFNYLWDKDISVLCTSSIIVCVVEKICCDIDTG